jgi:hypothetical protein
MAERDRFETDLADALRTYAESAPTQVRPAELARHIATVYPHRRILPGAWRPMALARPAAFGRFAWLLLLLAGLLVATFGGMLLVGSQAERDSKVVLPPVGELYECPPGSTPDEPGPVDQARPPGWAVLAFDRRAGRLITLASADDASPVETWTFDVCTNTWTRMHPDREPPSSGGLVYDVDSDVTILVTSGEVWAYDLGADTWTLKGSIPPIDVMSSIHVTSWAYDPVTGLVVATAAQIAAAADVKTSRPPELWSYDVATDAWTPIHQGGPAAAGDRGVGFAYDTSADRMVAYAVTGSSPSARYETWLLDLRTGSWSRAGAETPHIRLLWGFNAYPPAMVYDEAVERTVVSGTGGIAAYDATADRWEYLVGSADPELGRPRFGPSTQWVMDAYDPVNGRLVGRGDANSVWAFDPATRKWTVLLAASAGGTVPTDSGSGPVVSARPGWAEGLEAMLPTKVNGITFTKTSVVGGIPSTRLGRGGWATVPLGSDELDPFLRDHGKGLSDLNIAVATPTDASQADTFAIGFQVKGVDATELAALLTDHYGVGPGVTATVGGRQVQVLRDATGMGFDLYVKGDVVFSIFTDGTPLVVDVVAALP